MYGVNANFAALYCEDVYTGTTNVMSAAERNVHRFLDSVLCLITRIGERFTAFFEPSIWNVGHSGSRY
jgi:hypothetical protein